MVKYNIISDKSLGKSRDTKDVSQHSKDYLQQVYRQHHSKWRETQSFCIISMKDTRMSTSPFLFNMKFKILSRAVRQLKMIKGIQIGKKDAKVFLFVDDIIWCVKHHKDITRSPLHLINTFSKVAAFKISTQIQIVFQYISGKHTEKKNQGNMTFHKSLKEYLEIALTKHVKKFVN